jgi:hypothetical protein
MAAIRNRHDANTMKITDGVMDRHEMPRFQLFGCLTSRTNKPN